MAKRIRVNGNNDRYVLLNDEIYERVHGLQIHMGAGNTFRIRLRNGEETTLARLVYYHYIGENEFIHPLTSVTLKNRKPVNGAYDLRITNIAPSNRLVFTSDTTAIITKNHDKAFFRIIFDEEDKKMLMLHPCSLDSNLILRSSVGTNKHVPTSKIIMGIKHEFGRVEYVDGNPLNLTKANLLSRILQKK